MPARRYLYFFVAAHGEYSGDVFAPMPVGWRTSAHSDPVDSPVALKWNVALPVAALIRWMTSRACGAATTVYAMLAAAAGPSPLVAVTV